MNFSTSNSDPSARRRARDWEEARWGFLLSLLLGTTLIPVLCAFLLNSAIDPLWYGAGNQVFAENFPFNERFSKGNVFLRDPSRYDCLILGSSRTTLLDPEMVEGHRCFNFSVSNGNADEYEALVEFVSARTDLKLVILGVDAFNFSDHGLGSNLPSFILDGTEPVPAFASYLSLDVLEFSLRAIVSRKNRTRFYDREFKGNAMPERTPFPAPDRIDPEDPYGGLAESKTNTVGPFHPDRAVGLATRIRRANTSARLVGYVPPVASHFVVHIAASGNLDGYLESVWNASRGFDGFFDFSYVSPLTRNLDNTYDGSHYFRRANDEVAGILSGEAAPTAIALDLHRMDRDGYRERFSDALRAFAVARYSYSPR